MAFQNDKNELMETMGVFNVIAGLPNLKKINSMLSIDSASKNLLPYLIDVLMSLPAQSPKKPELEKPEIPNGTKKDKNSTKKHATPRATKNKNGSPINRILIEILTEFLPKLIKIIKEGVIQGIKSGLICGTDFTIPNPTPELTTTIDKLDLTGMMKMDPNGPAGALFGDPSKDFNRFLLDTITNQGSNTWVDRGGRGILHVTYNQPTASTDNQPTITMKIADGVVNSDGFDRSGTSFHDFLLDYVNSVEMFSLKNVLGTIMETMFGLISSANNLSVDGLISLDKMDMSVKKILDTDVYSDNVILDNSFYDFSNEELSFMERNASNKSRGVSVMDLGCGLVEVAVPLSILDRVGELDTATPVQSEKIIKEVLLTTSNSVSSYGSDTDGPTMKLNFEMNQILNFPAILMRMVVTPKIVGLYQISHQTINDTILNVSNGFDFSKSAKTFFEFVSREALAALLEIVFNIIKRELLILVGLVVAKIIKEKISLYIGSIAGIYISKTEAASDKIGAIEVPNPTSFV